MFAVATSASRAIAAIVVASYPCSKKERRPAARIRSRTSAFWTCATSAALARWAPDTEHETEGADERVVEVVLGLVALRAKLESTLADARSGQPVEKSPGEATEEDRRAGVRAPLRAEGSWLR